MNQSIDKIGASPLQNMDGGASQCKKERGMAHKRKTE